MLQTGSRSRYRNSPGLSVGKTPPSQRAGPGLSEFSTDVHDHHTLRPGSRVAAAAVAAVQREGN